MLCFFVTLSLSSDDGVFFLHKPVESEHELGGKSTFCLFNNKKNKTTKEKFVKNFDK